MIEIKGRYNTAVCYTDMLPDKAADQIKTICDQEVFKDSRIRIMPDVHAGKACTIGTTMTITDKVVPSMVGVDIGCGMETVQIDQTSIDFSKLDELIHSQIPCGRSIRTVPHPYTALIDLAQLRCAPFINRSRADLSLGSLGGGNHFIEADKAEDGSLYIVIHSGSRHLGLEVAEFYQKQGWLALGGGSRYQISKLIEELKQQGRQKEIQPLIEETKKLHTVDIPKDLAYVQGQLFDDYIHDMHLIQQYAVLNRKAMMDVIINGMAFTKKDEFTTVHNYIDTAAMILRKGAVSAKQNEKLLIPINMRDGSLICVGKGNEEWNCSAPHGAGRLMSRTQAFAGLTMQQYQQEMQGIYSSCINADTIDESPMAYKSMSEIIAQIQPTVTICRQIKPVYNFKASD